MECNWLADGVFRGTVGETATARYMVHLGERLSADGKVALGRSDGDAADMLARALSAGICAGGGTVLLHDGCCAAAAAWMANFYGISSSLYVQQEGEYICLYLFDERGLPPSRSRVEELKRRLCTGEGKTVRAGQVGCCEHLRAVNAAYIADAARRLPRPMFGALPVLSVPGDNRWDHTLTEVLERMGCRVLRRPTPGVASFSADCGGLRLMGRREDGAAVPPEQLLTLVALLYPQECTAAPRLRDALFAAGYLAAAMGERVTTLTGLLAQLQPRAVYRRDSLLRRDRCEAAHCMFREEEICRPGTGK